MPLLDHFHPPLCTLRHWQSFHARWASAIADALNRDLLPEDYFAEVQVHVGSRVEIDVAAFEGDARGTTSTGTGTATLPVRSWAPPAPTLVLPATFPDSLEVLVFHGEGGPTLVAAVELVSPGNKDRPETRRAFASKCASYLQQGIGLLVLDIVTSRQASLHNELTALLGGTTAFAPLPDGLSANSYRPVRHTDSDQIEVWSFSLAVGEGLPAVPLPLDRATFVRLDLEETYAEACRHSRLPQ